MSRYEEVGSAAAHMAASEQDHRYYWLGLSTLGLNNGEAWVRQIAPTSIYHGKGPTICPNTELI